YAQNGFDRQGIPQKLIERVGAKLFIDKLDDQAGEVVGLAAGLLKVDVALLQLLEAGDRRLKPPLRPDLVLQLVGDEVGRALIEPLEVTDDWVRLLDDLMDKLVDELKGVLLILVRIAYIAGRVHFDSPVAGIVGSLGVAAA